VKAKMYIDLQAIQWCGYSKAQSVNAVTAFYRRRYCRSGKHRCLCWQWTN